MTSIASRQELYNYFDGYTQERKEELNRRSLRSGTGLLKAYLIESDAAADDRKLRSVFRRAEWGLEQIDGALYEVGGLPEEMRAFLDVLTPRYLALYTTAKTEISDTAVKRTVRKSVELDHAWFASPILNGIWQYHVERTSQFATLRFETEPLFDALYTNPQYDDQAEEDDDEDEEDRIHERQVAQLIVKHRIWRLKDLTNGQRPFRELTSNLTRMRVPAVNDQGRYEYFQFGKLTNRGEEFRGFAQYLHYVADKIYGALTRAIEEKVAFYTERQVVPGGVERLNVYGAPVTFTFREPLAEDVFERFIEFTFDRGHGPFRLWGNPIRLSGPKVHVYGLDLHLWQRIFLDLSPRRFIVVLPEGTCGNTVHRLATNVQRYLDPQVDIFVGETSYDDLIRSVMRPT